jgi:hypothetical protein
MDISLQEILLPQDTPWDYFLYVVMFFQFLLLIALFNGSLRDVIFISIGMMAAIADKTFLFGYIFQEGCETIACAKPYHTEESFWTYVARVGMFFFPVLISTQTKQKAAKPLSVLSAILALVYTFSRWFFQQREVPGDAELSELPVHYAGTVWLLLSAWWFASKADKQQDS